MTEERFRTTICRLLGRRKLGKDEGEIDLLYRGMKGDGGGGVTTEEEQRVTFGKWRTKSVV